MKTIIIAAIMSLGISGCAQLQQVQGHLDTLRGNTQPDRCGEGNAWRYYPECDSYKAHVIETQQAQAADEQNELVLERRRVADVKLQARAEKKQAIIDAKDAKELRAYEAKEAADIKRRDAKVVAEEKRQTAKWNALTPAQQAAKIEENKAAYLKLYLPLYAASEARGDRVRANQDFERRSREQSAKQRAQGDRNVFCHRNFGRSC